MSYLAQSWRLQGIFLPEVCITKHKIKSFVSPIQVDVSRTPKDMADVLAKQGVGRVSALVAPIF